MRKTMMVVVVAGVLLAACGGGGDEGNEGGGGCSDLSSGASFSVEMQDNSFLPDCVIAKNTQTLDLRNAGSTNHTFTIPDTPIDVELSGGDQKQLPAPGDALAPGTYTFYCRFHGTPDGGGMAGEITVK